MIGFFGRTISPTRSPGSNRQRLMYLTKYVVSLREKSLMVVRK